MLARAMETGVLKALVPRGRPSAMKEESSCWGVCCFLRRVAVRWAALLIKLEATRLLTRSHHS